MTADQLEKLMDDAFKQGLKQAEHLNAVDGDGKARVTLKEITELLKVGVEYLAAKRPANVDSWGTALTGKGNGGAG